MNKSTFIGYKKNKQHIDDDSKIRAYLSEIENSGIHCTLELNNTLALEWEIPIVTYSTSEYTRIVEYNCIVMINNDCEVPYIRMLSK